MDRYFLKQHAIETVVTDLLQLVAHDRSNTAEMIAHIAEIDDRDHYAEVGYRSMHAWCVAVLHFSDDAAYKRITAARVALKFPVLFRAVADGRLHLAAVVTLAPVLTEKNVDRWIATATHKTRREIELLIAQDRPGADLPERVRRLPSRQTSAASVELDRLGTAPAMELAPGRVAMQSMDRLESRAGAIEKSASTEAPVKVAPGKITPLAPSRFGLQVTITQETREKLRRAQELMAHTTHPRDLATVLDRALDALITELEKRKLAATEQPRVCKPSTHARQIPAEVKRVVRARDGDRCAYVAKDGSRCEARSPLEFDHVVPVARGGTATVDNVRQLCRTHNRLEAERRLGREFMRRKISARQRVPIPTAVAPHPAASPV